MTEAKHPLSFLLGLILALGLVATSTLAFAADTSCGIVYVVDGSTHGAGRADAWHKRIQKFDTNGKFLGKFDLIPDGDISTDRLAYDGLTIDSKGNFYVLHAMHGWIRKFSHTGKYLEEFTGGKCWTPPYCWSDGIALDSKNVLYRSSHTDGQIHRFNSENGWLVVGHPPKMVGRSSTIGSDWLFAARANTSITIDASTAASASTDGTVPIFPKDMVIDSKDNVYVTERKSGGVVKFNSKGEIVRQWYTGFEGNAFGIAIDQFDNVYVTANTTKHTVKVYTSDGEFLRGFGGGSSAPARLPRGLRGSAQMARKIAVDYCGNVYVTTANDISDSRWREKHKKIAAGLMPGAYEGNVLLKYSPEGKLLDSWGGAGFGDGQFWVMGGIAIGKGSGRPKPKTAEAPVYVIDAKRVIRTDQTGNFPKTLTGPTREYHASLPSGWYLGATTGVAADSKGNVWVASSRANVLSKLAPDGTLLKTWRGEAGCGKDRRGWLKCPDGEFAMPFGVAVDSKNNVYVSDHWSGRITKLDSNGNFILKWTNGFVRIVGSGFPSTGTSGIAIDTKDNVYVGGTAFKRSHGGAKEIERHVIRVYDSTGEYIRSWGTTAQRTPHWPGTTKDGEFVSREKYLATDCKDNVYVVDRWSSRIQKFTNDGKFLLKWGTRGSGEGEFGGYNSSTGGQSPIAITIDGADNVYVTDQVSVKLSSGVRIKHPKKKSRVQKFTADGKFILSWSGYDIPDGIAVHKGGCGRSKTGGLTVGEFSSETSTSESVGKVKLYQHYNYEGIEKGYGVGDHVWIGDTYSGYLGLSSFKIPKGLSVTFYEGKGLTGKSYGPFDGALSYSCLGCAKHPMIPNDKIFSLKVTDISTKAKRKAEAEKRAKLEADKKAAVAKAKAAAELAKKKEECKADVVFLMDNTGSMGSVIKATKKSAANILNKISGADPRFKGLDVQFGVATYWGDPKEHKCETKETGVNLYQHWHYGGKKKTYSAGMYNNITDVFRGGLGVSSFKLPSGLSLYMYSKKGGGGTKYGPFDGPMDIPCLAYPGGPSCPHKHAVNDNVRSIKVEKTKGVRLYSHAEYNTRKGPAGAKLFSASKPSAKSLIYVADTDNHRIMKYNKKEVVGGCRLSGCYVARWGKSGRDRGGELFYPQAVRVDVEGNVWVADSRNDRIQKFDPDGKFLLKFGSSGSTAGQFNKPKGIAFDSRGNIFVLDQDNHRIQKFDSERNFLLQWGSHGSGNSQFKHPWGMAIDSDDNVYVGDYWNHRVQKFDSSGTYLTKWGSRGSGNGQFNYPHGIAIDNTDNVYVVEYHNHRVQKFNSSGKYLTKWGRRGTRSGDFSYPSDIDVDQDDNIYVLEAGINRIQKFSSDGHFLEKLPASGFNWASGFDVWDAPGEDPKKGVGKVYKRKSYQYGEGEYASISSVFPSGSALGVSSVKVPSGFNLEMYEKANFKGKKYGPFSGSHDIKCMATDADCKHSAIPDNTIASIKVTGGIDLDEGFKECARKAYKVNQPLTKSKESAASAMKQWKACSAPGGCGEDIPEANFFALHQLATEGEITDGKGTSDKGFASGYKIGWREDAGRVVVWFGDAPSHTTTVDREEASQALLDNKILVTAINTQGKGAGMDSTGSSGVLPHYCSVKTCEWGKGKCDAYACETDGSCAAWGYDCSLISKPKLTTGQATHIASITRGTVHHKITGGDKVVKTILEAAAAGIADAGVGSAVTFTGGFLARDSKVFFGKMDPKNWSGDVQAWPLNEETAAIDVAKGKVWSAAETMDAGSSTSRVMLTYQRAVTDAKGVTTPGEGIALRWDELSDEQKADMQSNHKGEVGDEKEGETRLSFLRGDRTDEGKGYGFRIRDSRLGDIWHSSPVHVGAPRPPRWMPRIESKEAADMFKAYLSFVRTSGGREPIVYVGANDGALHGFNAKTGAEVLSYFPAALYASLKDSKGGGYHKLANPEYSHTDYVDATPSVFDAYLRGDGGSMEWQSVLIGSLGGGGRGLFALDVTDPSAFSEANADDIVLGEFSNADDAHFGYSYSKPRFGRMNNGRWAVIIGNGLKDTATDETGGQAQLFIVYLDGDTPGADGKWDLGKDYIRIATGKGSAEVGLRNGLFTPTIVDLDGNGTIDRVYAGDLQGNLWAFDLSGRSSRAWKVAMDKKPLLKATGNQPITAAPLVVRPDYRAMGRTRRDAPGLMVMFGTGRFLKDRDKVYTDPQRFYAVYDRGMSIQNVKKQLVQQPLKQKTIETATGESRKIRLTKGKLKVPYSHSEFPKYGWYMNLPEKGERVVSEAKFQRGVVYFNSIVPDLSVCSSGGEGWEMAVKLVNGGNPKAGNHDVNEDEKVDGDDAADKDGDEAPAGKRLEGRGMPTGPKLFGDRRFTASSKMEDGSDLKTTALERIARERQGRLSWSELQPRTN